MARYRSWMSVAVVCALESGAALAAADDLFALSIEELLRINITSATLQDESLLSIPSATTVYTRDQWQRMGISRLEELMNFVPGYQAYRGGGAAVQWQFSSRGRRNGYASREILILVDGMRHNEDWAGGTFYSTVLSLENAQRVEFLRGPGSAIYGGNAFLGVVNIVTEARREVTAEVGSDGRQRVAAHWKSDSGPVPLGVSVEHLGDDGQALQAFNPHAAVQAEQPVHDGYQYDSVDLRGQVSGLGVRARYSESSEDDFYNVGRLLGDKHLDNSRLQLHVKYDQRLNTRWQSSSYVQFDERKQVAEGYETPSQTLFQRVSFEEQEWALGSVFNYRSQDLSRGVLGIEWRRPDHVRAESALSGLINSTLPLADTDTRIIGAVFGQWQQTLAERWHATMGARFDHYSDFGDHASPRLGLIFNADAENSLKLLYGEAFRAPTWNELYAKNNLVLIGNPDLDAEVAKTTELVWVHVQPKGLLQATLFHVQIVDAIRRNPATLSFENTVNESIDGLGLEFRTYLHPHWQLLATGNWITSEATVLNTEADLFGSLSLQYQHDRLSASLQVYYQGDRENASAASLPNQMAEPVASRSPVSAHVQYEFDRQLKVYFTAKNLLDEDSYSAADNPANPVGVPNRGRELMLGVRWQY